MNSLIITFICTVWGKIYKAFSESVFWNALGKIHSSFSEAFKGSAIVAGVKYNGKVSYEETSFACKLLRIPTAVASSICKIFSKFVKGCVDKSSLSKYIRGFVSGFLSLNVRFFALLVLFSAVSGFAVNLFFGRFNTSLIAVALAGFAFSFIKGVKLADYIDKSVIVHFIKNSLGFENISFKIYKTEPKTYVYGSAAVVGIVSGILGGVNPLLYVFPAGLMAVFGILMNPVFGIFVAVFVGPILPTMALVGVCVLTILSVLGHKSYTGEYRIKMGRCGLALMLFLIVAAISTLFSSTLTGSIGVLGMYIIFIGFYYIIRDQIRSENTLSGLLKVFALSAAVVSVYGIFQYVFKWDTQNAWIDTDMFEEATMRAYSTLANPNVLGEYLLLALPITALVIINYTNTIWQKIVYGGMFAASFICLILTQSRGCWIGFIVTCAIFVTYYRSKLWKFLPFLIILLPFVLPETIVNRILSVGNMSDSSTSYRVYIWFGTLLMLKDYWLGGIGLGEAAFRNVYPAYSYHGIVAPHSHNLYLQLIVESGVVGLGAFVFSIIVFFKDMINVQLRDKKYAIAATALISAVAGFLVQGMFDYTFYNYRVMSIFFMVLAMGGALATISGKDKTQAEFSNERNS